MVLVVARYLRKNGSYADPVAVGESNVSEFHGVELAKRESEVEIERNAPVKK